MIKLTLPVGTTVGALGLAMAGVAAVALATPERIIGGNVSAYLGQDGRVPAASPVAGTEAFWLSGLGAPADGPAGTLGRAVAPGDQITIGSAGDVKRVLEVVELRELPSAVLPASNAAASARLLLVTCRDTAGGTVRFIIEAEPADAGLTAPAQKVL